jgi:predicted nucleotide-binding protein (sugar kinase/HSP70/actin superfamily)
MALIYGDIMMRVTNRMRPYEKVVGTTDSLEIEWDKKIDEQLKSANYFKFRKNVREIIRDFDKIETIDAIKPKVGVVGEILVKYHPTANNELVKVIEENGGEAVVPDMMDFFTFGLYNAAYNAKNFKRNKFRTYRGRLFLYLSEKFRGFARDELKKSKHFEPMSYLIHTAKNASKILQLGHQTGEG